MKGYEGSVDVIKTIKGGGEEMKEKTGYLSPKKKFHSYINLKIKIEYYLKRSEEISSKVGRPPPPLPTICSLRLE